MKKYTLYRTDLRLDCKDKPLEDITIYDISSEVMSHNTILRASFIEFIENGTQMVLKSRLPIVPIENFTGNAIKNGKIYSNNPNGRSRKHR